MTTRISRTAALTLLMTGGAALAAPTIAQRTAAVNDVVTKDAACTSITPFYWEIGDTVGAKAKGTGGNGVGTPITATSQVPVASSSKWVFATVMVEKALGAVTPDMIKQLTLTGGYTNFNACTTTTTVSGCLKQTGVAGGKNGDYVPMYDGSFYYGSGHMQVLGDRLGYGANNNASLTNLVKALPNTKGITYTNPQLGGGIGATPTGFGGFLRNMMNGTYKYMPALLGTNAICTTPNTAACPMAVYSPVNNTAAGTPNSISNEQWHYSLGHWVEDDPVVGDGAFSSPGRFGFYPWISASRQWYGVLARYDQAGVNNADPKTRPYYSSVQCGRKMRAAWMNPPAAVTTLE
jgi:hypothetical protein